MNLLIKDLDFLDNLEIDRIQLELFVSNPQIKTLGLYTKADVEVRSDMITRRVEVPCQIIPNVDEIKEKLIKYGFKAPDMTVTEFVEDELEIREDKL